MQRSPCPGIPLVGAPYPCWTIGVRTHCTWSEDHDDCHRRPAARAPAAVLLDILLTWFSIGIQSFGGGSTTLYLIRQTCITRGWLTDAEFAKDWALVQISPGINLIKITVVIGHQLRGWPCLLAAISGLLLPSATITVLMTAGFVIIRDWPFVKAAMRGVIPATIGISVGLGIQMAQAPLSRAPVWGVPA